MSNDLKADMIAPCGINCALCYAHMRKKNTCGGCRNGDNLPGSCLSCIIRNCDKREDVDFCYTCAAYPCARFKSLDKRYRTKYATNLKEIQETIKTQGINALLEQLKEQWTCPDCGSLICIHRGTCDVCAPKQ